MSHRLLRCALLALSIAGLTACTTTTSGSPAPGGDSDPTSTSSPSAEPPSGDDLPSDGAPKVTNPIDATHFEQNPCDALTSEQPGTLNVGPAGEPADTNFGKGCSWRNSGTGGSAIVTFLSAEKRGLSSAYRSNSNGDFTYFEPLPDIEDFPAVAFDTKAKNPTTECSVAVGLSDELVFVATTSLSSANVGQKDPCEVGATVATEMTKTIKDGP